MIEAAPAHGFRLERVVVRLGHDPLRRAKGVVVVDSLVASAVAPWAVRPGNGLGRLAALVHQVPGGVDGGPIGRRARARIDGWLYRRCSLLIVASPSLALELVDGHGVRAERITVVEPGRTLPVHRSGPLDLRAGRSVALLTVANWTPNKGILELLDAFAGLPPALATLHLAGRDDVDAPYTKRVRARLAAPDLAGRVVVHGAVHPDHVGALYAGADLFVAASYAEAYGTVYGEALAAGLPIVGWRAGNLPNLVEDGREGCLVRPGDVRALREALMSVATDARWRDRLSAAAARRGQQLPTWDAAADAFFAALKRLGPD